MLRWGDAVADGGVDRGVNTLGGGGTGARGDTTGGGTTLEGSIDIVTVGGCGMGGGCSGCNLAKRRGIGRGSQLRNSYRRLVISVSCS